MAAVEVVVISWIQIPAFPFISCIILGKTLYSQVQSVEMGWDGLSIPRRISLFPPRYGSTFEAPSRRPKQPK